MLLAKAKAKNKTMKLFLLLLPFLCISCTNLKTGSLPKKVLVDVSQGKLKVVKGSKVLAEMPVETSRKGTGTRLNSNKTPLGEYCLVKEPKHRFGLVLRLDHYQGWRRGILFHRDFINGNGTGGCICPLNSVYMHKLYHLVDNGTPVIITL